MRTRIALVLGSLVAGMLAVQAAPGAPTDFVEMSDGTSIAISVHFPEGYTEGDRLPTIFEMSGYDGGSAQHQTLAGDIADLCASTFSPFAPYNENCDELPLQGDSRGPTFMYTDAAAPHTLGYVVVHASVRGSGCSGGEFDLFSRRQALDGKEIIDGWIPRQPWYDGTIGITGHSYSGITGFLVAATQPRHLTAVTLSGLIDDLYRGIVYPGGVTNYGFPLLWTGAVRPVYDIGGGLAPGLVRPPADDPDQIRQRCVTNTATKSRTVLNDPIIQGLSDVDSDWWRARALIEHADRITVPIHITGAYQDEQTGPRGPANLFEHVENAPNKRLVLTNGDHGTASSDWTNTPDVWQDRLAWMDHWLHGSSTRAAERGYDPADASSVRVLLETHRDGSFYGANSMLDRTSFPLEDTRWRHMFLHTDGLMTEAAAVINEHPSTYVSGSMRQSWSYQAGPRAGQELTTPDGPDELTFYGPQIHDEPMVIAGPVTATLYLQTSAPDTELFVQLIDEDLSTGERTYLQRGMLRAAHNHIWAGDSDCADVSNANARISCADAEPEDVMYRPFRPHSRAVPVVPGEVNEYVVEIFPVGHVFRPGHQLVVKVMAPPLVDSYYVYVPKRVPSINTITYGPGSPSRVTLPVIPLTEAELAALGDPIPCGEQDAVRCTNA